MKTRLRLLLCVAAAGLSLSSHAATNTILGWNNLGMHCMDRDYSVFTILPPYNTVEAQLIVNGKLVTNGAGYQITYEATADPDGSINSTSVGKGNFYEFTPFLYGPLAADAGLAGWGMPGPSNIPQAMVFESTNHPAAGVSTRVNWFRAEGIPLTPFDDALKKNPYPIMKLVARNSAGAVIATNRVVLPVSDEMDCRACHASGSLAEAQPISGWVNHADAERDYRLNILLLHDEHQFQNHTEEYAAALSDRGFNAAGLYANVVTNGKPVLCAVCHASEALGTASFGTVPALTTSVHSWHAHVKDPVTGLALNDSNNRASCYRCHPGSATKCLRGAMGSAVAADGSMAMQCQSCHGSMSQVGASNRVGWFMEPNCQSCHSGTAVNNNGQIRYTSVFADTNGTMRTAVDQTFATTPNTPAPGLSLYRFSTGHGGLQCEACHGSTHAEFPSSHRNDNLRNIDLQGHAGVMSECTSCHTNAPTTVNGGPHGMHPVGQTWVSRHQSAAQSNRTQCQACHGTDYRGTVLSRMLADRTLSALGTKNLFRGAIIGCYTCHQGPSNDSGNNSTAPTVSSASAATRMGVPVSLTLPLTGAGATLRIISQASSGSVGLSNNIATYFPDPDFTGVDTFTFAAYDGSKNSTLATGTVSVIGLPAIISGPTSRTVNAGENVSFSVTASGTPPLTYQWQRNATDLPGATGATLSLTNVTSADVGSYTVTVSNPAGSVTSTMALLQVISVPVNQPPTVQLVQPRSGSTFRESSAIHLSAHAYDTDGSIAKVEFFAGTDFLGTGVRSTINTNAFTFVWRNVPAGRISLTAKATDDQGATAASAPVTITIR